jgi:DNA-binding MarR family transcriptional regulator
MINEIPSKERLTFLIQLLTKFSTYIYDINFIKKCTALPLSRRQFEILKILYVSGAFTISELAHFLSISRAAASKSVDNLVKFQLVQRQVPAGDRRKAVVSILPKGEAISACYFQLLQEQENLLLDHFTPAELEQFENFVNRYIRMLMAEYLYDADLVCLSCNTKFSDECPLVEEGHASCYHMVVEPQE